MGLVRLRANPKKIRVSMVWLDGFWSASVEERSGMKRVVYANHERPSAALVMALRSAEGFVGLDLGMQWAYEHPWGGE